MTVVKICGLTNLEDARWACRCGADLLGFVFVPSSARCVPAARVAKIIHALTSEGYRARPVGVFANQPLDALRRTAEMCSLQLVQLHGGEGPGYAHALGLPFIVARRVRDRVPWEELSEYQAWAYLLDSYDPGKLGGTGHAWRWEMLGDPQPDVRLIVAGGLTPDNVAAWTSPPAWRPAPAARPQPSSSASSARQSGPRLRQLLRPGPSPRTRLRSSEETEDSEGTEDEERTEHHAHRGRPR